MDPSICSSQPPHHTTPQQAQAGATSKNAPMRCAAHASDKLGTKTCSVLRRHQRHESDTAAATSKKTPFSDTKQKLSFRLRCMLLSAKPFCVTARLSF